MGEEEEEFKLNREELELFYEILFRKIMELMKKPKIEIDPFGEMINILSTLSGIFTFKSMISLIPELVAYAIRYGMMVEQAYEDERTSSEEDLQGVDKEEEQLRRISKLRDDIDKLSIYL
ncbi:MAG: hypothetical protein ACFFFB_24785 [Candidatus Heimdallarchaeota archaeon]